MKHGFLPGAQAEYLQAVRFYEEQRAGLGAALVAEFEHVVSLAEERPAACKLVYSSDIRRIGLFGFIVLIDDSCSCEPHMFMWII